MIRIALMALAGALVAVAAALAAPTAREATATLRLTSTKPLTLRGAAFKPRERVTVTVTVRSLGERRVRKLRAGATGGFVARFTTLESVDRCQVVAVAVGARGSRAAVKLPQPQCRPKGSPATLRVTDTAPVEVAGARFLPRERVVLRATGEGAPRTVTVRAGATGAFTGTFSDLTVRDRCNSDLLVRAFGARGTEAVAKIGPLPQCAPRG